MYYLEAPMSVALTESEIVFLHYAVTQMDSEALGRFATATHLPAPDTGYMLDVLLGSALDRAQGAWVEEEDED